jgi:hypothetical protein
MTFEVQKASSYSFKDTVEISTLEDLKELYDKYGQEDLVVDFKDKEITIYDGYLE